MSYILQGDVVPLEQPLTIGGSMSAIYLDRQLQIESYEGANDINSAIQKCLEAGFIFPYSPAHIEELSGAFCREKIDDLDVEAQ
jgi:hypothetical protein